MPTHTEDVTRYVADWLRRRKAVDDVAWRKLADELGCSHAALKKIHDGDMRVGQELETVFADHLHAGSVDALRRAARKFRDDQRAAELDESDRLTKLPGAAAALAALPAERRAAVRELAWRVVGDDLVLVLESARRLALELRDAGVPWAEAASAALTASDADVGRLARPLASAVVSFLGGVPSSEPRSPRGPAPPPDAVVTRIKDRHALRAAEEPLPYAARAKERQPKKKRPRPPT